MRSRKPASFASTIARHPFRREIGEEGRDDVGVEAVTDPLLVERPIRVVAVGLQELRPRREVDRVGLRERAVEVEEQGPEHLRAHNRGTC